MTSLSYVCQIKIVYLNSLWNKIRQKNLLQKFIKNLLELMPISENNVNV